MINHTERKRFKVNSKFIAVCSIAGVIVGVLLSNQSLQIEFWKRVNPAKVLRMASAQLNKSLPKKVNEITRWERTTALPNLTLRYEYTLQSVDGDPETLKSILQPKLINAYRTLDDMQVFREIGATIIFRYCDPAGNEIAEITISPEML